MGVRTPDGPGWQTMKRRALLVLGSLFLGGLAFLLGWSAWRGNRRAEPLPPSSSIPLNARPEIRYVGDAACMPCHQSEATAYHQHPMAQSCGLARFTPDQTAPKAADSFLAAGYEFQVERRDAGMVHRTRFRGADRAILAESQATIAYEIGANRRGRSYVINRDGYLSQSPISWYADRNRWDLSPHLGASLELLYRPVQVQCLFCHCNSADAVAHSGNRYRPSDLQLEPIGCERCHGPGELHVASRTRGEAVALADPTIVHPGRLTPELREAVCQQCHLVGVTRVLRRGRQAFDYRPGLPLSDFWTIFVRPNDQGIPTAFSSEVEQIETSRCFRESQGRLGCTSCHDPHALPTAQERDRHFRDRCLACHAEQSCSLPLAERRQSQPNDSCVACHMPRLPTSNLTHMASTDHRLRVGSTVSPPAPLARLEPFHRQSAVDGDAERDRGIALMDLAAVEPQAARRTRFAEEALEPLTRAVDQWPDDVAAWQARGYAEWNLGRLPTALSAFETALQLAPDREETLQFAAAVAGQLQRTEQALAYWDRAAKVNPWSPRPWIERARLWAGSRMWKPALEACHQAIALQPFLTTPREIAVECWLGLEEMEPARRELERLIELNPAQESALRDRFRQVRKSGESDNR